MAGQPAWLSTWQAKGVVRVYSQIGLPEWEHRSVGAVSAFYFSEWPCWLGRSCSISESSYKSLKQSAGHLLVNRSNRPAGPFLGLRERVSRDTCPSHVARSMSSISFHLSMHPIAHLWFGLFRASCEVHRSDNDGLRSSLSENLVWAKALSHLGSIWN